MLGPIAADTRFGNDAIVLSKGTVVSGGMADTQRDDLSYFTLESDNGKVEFEVTSGIFDLEKVDTLVVPFVVRSNQTSPPPAEDGEDAKEGNKDVEVEIRIYDPADPKADDDGFSKIDKFKQKIRASDIDRYMAFEVGEEAVAYINTLTDKFARVRMTFKGKKEFQVELDRMSFFATSTEVRDTLLPEASHQFIDPTAGAEEFKAVPPGASFVIQLNNVQAGLFSVNWAFLPMPVEDHNDHNPDHDQVSIKVFRGTVLDDGAEIPLGRYFGDPKDKEGNDLVASAHIHPNHGETFVRTGYFEVQPGIYTFIFSNDVDKKHEDGPTVYTKPFSQSGGTEGTWIFGSSYRDYLILTKYGGVAVKSVVRQVPGPIAPLPWTPEKSSLSPHQVLIQSWHEPSGVADIIYDRDNDRIWDTIDGAFENGALVDERLVKSRRFTDQHLGGVTYGSVVESAGLDVNVADLTAPGLGVLITVSGLGTNNATISLCGTRLYLTNGDVFVGTCGSTEVTVHSGPVEIELNKDLTAAVPTAGAAKVTVVARDVVNLENIDDDQPLVISSKDGVIELTAGSAVVVQAGAGLPSPTPTPFGTPNPSPTAVPTPTPFPTATPQLPPTPTPTPVGGQTATPVPIATPAATTTPTLVSTATPTPTPGPTPTLTPVLTATPTSTPGPTPVPVPTGTPLPTPTPAPTATPAPTPTPVPSFASDSLEFDTEQGKTADVIAISGNIYAIAYSGSGDDGFLSTFEVSADGQITDTVIDTLEFDDSKGKTPSIVLVSGNVYAVAYAGNGDAGFVKTVEISSSGQITNSVIDTLEFDSDSGKEPVIISVSGNVYAVVYEGNDGDGYLKTISITTAGQIANSVIDTLEFDTSQGESPSITPVSGDIYAIAYSGSGSDGFVKTVDISAAGDISDAVIDTLEFDTTLGKNPEIIKVSGNVYAVAYAGNGDDGFVTTIEISTSGQITDSAIDTLEWDTSKGKNPKLIKVSGNVYAVAYAGNGDDGFVKTIETATNGQITDTVIDTLEFDTLTGKTPAIIHISGDVFAVAYEGPGSDGFLKTIKITTSGGIQD